MGLYVGDIIIERIFCLRFGGAYFWEGLFSEGLIIAVLRYIRSGITTYCRGIRYS